MEKITSASSEPGNLLKQLQFIHNSKASDIPALCALEQSKSTPVRHAASKRRHVLENYELMKKLNPRAHISKGKSEAGCSRARTGDARAFQRF